MFSGDFRLLEFYKVPNIFFPSPLVLCLVPEAVTCVYIPDGSMCQASRKSTPTKQKWFPLRFVCIPLQTYPPIYRLDNTYSDWLPFLTRASIIEFSGWIGPASANNNLPNPIALIIHKVKMWWNKLDNKRSLSYYICFGGYWCIL